MIQVRVSRGPDTGEQINTHRGTLSVGRSPNCDLVLHDDKVSHLHGELLFVGLNCFYRDLLSRNGSFLRRDEETIWLGPLKPEREVKAGDEIIMGDTTILLEAVEPSSMYISELIEDVPWQATMPLDVLQEQSDEDRGLSALEFTQFQEFLKLPEHDASNVNATKAAICDALVDLFPNTARVALVDLLPGRWAEITRDSLDAENVVFAPRGDTSTATTPTYSVHVMAETYAKRRPLLYGNAPVLPDAISVQKAAMQSCICLPLGQGDEIFGFLHMYTTTASGGPYTPRDAQLLCVLASLVSLLINQAKDAQQRSQWRAVAAAGEAISGLSHDAQSILSSLFKNVVGVKRAYPDLDKNADWKHVSDDMKFLKWLVSDAMDRARAGRGDLSATDVELHSVVEDTLKRCRRHFVEKAHSEKVRLSNDCLKTASAFVNKNVLFQAVMNCVRNSLQPLRQAWHDHENMSGCVRILWCKDPNEDGSSCLLSICDNVGGISKDVLRQFGSPFVAGENIGGLGLGMYLVAGDIQRLGGQVQIATSTRRAGDLPAGTVVSFRLPKNEQAYKSLRTPGDQPNLPHIVVIDDYVSYREQIEAAKFPLLQENH